MYEDTEVNNLEKQLWQLQRRQPAHPCLRSQARLRFKRCVWPRMAGILATPRNWLWRTRSIRDGETAQSSLTDETKSLPSCRASGARSWITDSSRNCGLSPRIASRYASLTNGTMTQVTGIALTEMRIGSSMTTGS